MIISLGLNPDTKLSVMVSSFADRMFEDLVLSSKRDGGWRVKLRISTNRSSHISPSQFINILRAGGSGPGHCYNIKSLRVHPSFVSTPSST